MFCKRDESAWIWSASLGSVGGAGGIASTEGREEMLSKDWRGEDVCGATMAGMDGMDMVGMGVEAGWSTITGAAASRAGCAGSGTAMSSGLEGPCWSGSEAGAVGSSAFESMLVRDVSAAGGREVGNAGLSGREPRSDEGRESERSVALLTALARRSCSREFGLLRDGFREASGRLASMGLAATLGLWGYPPASTASFLSTAAAALSVAAGFGPVEPSSARMVSSRDSRPERALFHQPLPLMLLAFYFLPMEWQRVW